MGQQIEVLAEKLARLVLTTPSRLDEMNTVANNIMQELRVPPWYEPKFPVPPMTEKEQAKFLRRSPKLFSVKVHKSKSKRESGGSRISLGGMR